MKSIRIIITLLLSCLTTALAAGQVVHNKPMEPGVQYQISGFRPTLTVELGPNDTEVFRDSANGMHVVGHADKLGEFTLKVVDPGALVYANGTRPAAFDAFWVPTQELPPGFDLVRELDKIPGQHKWYTPGTGGFGRGYVSPASVPLAAPLSEDNDAPWTLRRKALGVLRSWVIEELETRPLSHVPLIASGDAYSQKDINKGTDREWNHQKRNVYGANAFDTAHLFNSHGFALACYGDPLGILWVSLVERWCLMSAFPGHCTNWITQPRGDGWVLELSAEAHVLRLWPTEESRAVMHCGLTTEEAAERWVRMSASEHWNRGVGTGDTHNSPKLRDADGKIVEVDEWAGHLGFHEAIRLWGLARVIKSDLPRETRQLARQVYDEELAYMLEVAIDSGRGAMSRLIGTWRFESQLEAQAEAQRATAAGGNVWLPFYQTQVLGDLMRPAGWRMREVPRIPDAQLLAAALAPVVGFDYPAVQGWLGNRDKPEWTYDLVVFGMGER